MTKSELVSVIIPAYNAEKFIAKTLKSLLQQTYTSFEILVIDDSSTDNTKVVVDSFVKKHPKIVKYYKNKKNVGASASRNSGVKKAHGSLVLFCDSDDEFKSDHIMSLATQLGSHMLDAVSALTRHTIDEQSNTLHYKSHRYWGTDEYKLFILGLTGCDLLIKKSTFTALGGFNEAIKYAEDWDLQVRLVHAGYRYETNDDATVRHREHDNSITSNFSWTNYRVTTLLPSLIAVNATTKKQLAVFTFGTLLHASLKTNAGLLMGILRHDPIFFIRRPYSIQVGTSALLQRIRRKVKVA